MGLGRSFTVVAAGAQAEARAASPGSSAIRITGPVSSAT